MESYIILDKNLAQVIAIIKRIVQLHSIYLIGSSEMNIPNKYILDSKMTNIEKHEFTYSLVLITHDFIADPKTFMNDVFNKTGEKCRIFSIHYTLNDTKYRLRHGDNFLSRILSSENEVYCSEHLLCCGYSYHPKMYAKIKKEWEFRMNRAYYFEDKVSICDDVYDETSRMLLISQSLQQACAALLNIFWEYKPCQYDLNHLLNLCLNFSKSPEILFPKISFRSHRVFNAICHAQYNVNFKSVDDVSHEDSNYAHQLCRRFLDKADKEGKKKLQELESLHRKFEVQ